jgi:hypothetical protein
MYSNAESVKLNIYNIYTNKYKAPNSNFPACVGGEKKTKRKKNKHKNNKRLSKVNFVLTLYLERATFEKSVFFAFFVLFAHYAFLLKCRRIPFRN